MPCGKQPGAASSRFCMSKSGPPGTPAGMVAGDRPRAASTGHHFKAVQQPFDLGTPEGKLLFHLVSSLGEFYSDNLSKETNKGKLERSLQGYHNGAVPWGYISQLSGQSARWVFPIPRRPRSWWKCLRVMPPGAYSDMQIAEWLNSKASNQPRPAIW